jgi:hypothetical protein
VQSGQPLREVRRPMPLGQILQPFKTGVVSGDRMPLLALKPADGQGSTWSTLPSHEPFDFRTQILIFHPGLRHQERFTATQGIGYGEPLDEIIINGPQLLGSTTAMIGTEPWHPTF